MDDSATYSIVWHECGENSSLAERFYVPGFVGYLPFFISGMDNQRLENKETIQLKEEHLLKGILYGLHDYEKKGNSWYTENGRETYLYLLDILGNGFGFSDPENLILSVAGNARSKNGHAVSYAMLLSGIDLLPNSSKIMSDLIIDLWEILSNLNIGNFYNEGLGKIVELIFKINMEDVMPQAREMISYFGFTALMILGLEDKVDEYLNNFIFPNVNNAQLKIRIREMIENPQNAKIESFEQER